MTIGRPTRRRVLQSMLAGPVLAGLGPTIEAFGQDTDPIVNAPDQALDVFDFERVARERLPPAHFGYLATGVDGDATLRANTAGFANYNVRVRRLVDLSRIDTSVQLFGTSWDSPIVLDPVGSQRAFRAIARPAIRATGRVSADSSPANPCSRASTSRRSPT